MLPALARALCSGGERNRTRLRSLPPKRGRGRLAITGPGSTLGPLVQSGASQHQRRAPVPPRPLSPPRPFSPWSRQPPRPCANPAGTAPRKRSLSQNGTGGQRVSDHRRPSRRRVTRRRRTEADHQRRPPGCTQRPSRRGWGGHKVRAAPGTAQPPKHPRPLSTPIRVLSYFIEPCKAVATGKGKGPAPHEGSAPSASRSSALRRGRLGFLMGGRRNG